MTLHCLMQWPRVTNAIEIQESHSDSQWDGQADVGGSVVGVAADVL